MRNRLKIGALSAVVAVGALVATAASADVACNRYGECWTVHERYTTYPTTLGIIFHDDAWKAAHHRHYHWRSDRDNDKGYYSRGVWTPF
jgi:sterol desaturase/sphingolipid hydroxylase (fatty acid hydroxylase superfamily)